MGQYLIRKCPKFTKLKGCKNYRSKLHCVKLRPVGAKKIADALEVSLDYLVGEGVNSKFDKLTLKRIEEIQELDEDKKRPSLRLTHFIRESKGREAFMV